MTVFIAHTPADHEIAVTLEKFIERRGQFCELDDGQTAQRPVQASDVVVLLLSKDFALAPTRLRLEQRALDAWADGRLLVVKLDKAIAPVGLRDLPAIDATFKREFKWQEVADAIRQRAQVRSATSAPSSPPAPIAAKRRRGSGAARAVASLLLALPGVLALAVIAAIWLVNRIGATPGGIGELRSGVDAFGARFGLGALATEGVFAIAIALTFAVLGSLIASIAAPARRIKSVEPAPPPEEENEEENNATPAGVFVSYARANADAVMPVIEGAKQSGRAFWLDQQGIVAGDTWAGEIVRAIRGAADVVVMCSKAAFDSDHVKREIYLADRYSKRLVPVFIEEATPPEDFEYFFAGVQFLRLFETPEAERSQALVQALGAS